MKIEQKLVFDGQFAEATAWQKFYYWISNDPSQMDKLFAALVAAIAAIMAVFIAQWITGRRERTELLTKKLEEIFLLLNDISILALRKLGNLPKDLNESEYEESVDSFIKEKGYDIHKKINMLVYLYFPELIKTHKETAACRIEIQTLIEKNKAARTENNFKSLVYFLHESGDNLENEIVENRAFLTKSILYPKRYVRHKNRTAERLELKIKQIEQEVLLK